MVPIVFLNRLFFHTYAGLFYLAFSVKTHTEITAFQGYNKVLSKKDLYRIFWADHRSEQIVRTMLYGLIFFTISGGYCIKYHYLPQKIAEARATKRKNASRGNTLQKMRLALEKSIKEEMLKDPPKVVEKAVEKKLTKRIEREQREKITDQFIRKPPRKVVQAVYRLARKEVVKEFTLHPPKELQQAAEKKIRPSLEKKIETEVRDSLLSNPPQEILDLVEKRIELRVKTQLEGEIETYFINHPTDQMVESAKKQARKEVVEELEAHPPQSVIEKAKDQIREELEERLRKNPTSKMLSVAKEEAKKEIEKELEESLATYKLYKKYLTELLKLCSVYIDHTIYLKTKQPANKHGFFTEKKHIIKKQFDRLKHAGSFFVDVFKEIRGQVSTLNKRVEVTFSLKDTLDHLGKTYDVPVD